MIAARARQAGAILLGLALTLTVMTGAAHAAADTTPPRLTLPALATFQQGASLNAQFQIGAYTYDDGIPMTVSWRASDASGICGYDVYEHRAQQDPDGVLVLSNTRRTTYTGRSTDYTNQQGGGGGGWLLGWRVVAHDCAGNETSKFASARPSMTQENGLSDDELPATIAYRGSWTASSCTCYEGGGTRKTSASGARAVISFDSAANAPVALVMEKAPNRGRFTLLIDGVNRGTVDTYSSTPLHRVVVWSGRVSSAGHHVVTLVNQATPGRPRIDLDAVLLAG